ncbi:hypothetical protein PPERSA_03186 [Pseudocohnilembus persalinus]|uniref:Uncharacterized protein n=1 Tax=Pseudocohnilembus persalinus TaxID=266149 RepID=A0A0V0QE28_PSEPJ|nr:hypothetical protein PPERSA_03186 [Pseudocohnilembus persalinus]|eukprot:KRX00453.1 hypothetical protein PPERSA_03186 [Pseudocohnilembus persalinus]
MDEFTEKTVSKLSPEFIQELMKNKQDSYKQETQRQIIIKQNQEINYENQNLIQKVRKEEIFYRYISHILKQDYSTFDPKYEQYLDYSFLLENSYPLDPKTFKQDIKDYSFITEIIKFENLNTDDSLKKAKQVSQKLLEQYQEIVKSQGDYTIFLKNKEPKSEKTSIYISKLISSNIILIGQLFEQNIEEMVTDHSKEIKVQYYLIHMQFSENNTNPSRDSIEEYLKMTEDYLKSFQKSYNQVFSNLIYQACSLGLSVETESLQKGILSCRSTQKVHHISMNELYNIFQWYNRDLSKKYKKANFIKSSLNAQDQSFAFQADRPNKQKESFFLKNNKEENSNCSLLLQSNIEQRNQNKQENQQNQENSHSQPQPQPNLQSQYPQEILELPDFMGKFQDDILEPANQSFEWVINYFFQKIEGTEYYYKKIQDQNYITKAQQNNFFIQEFVQFLETQKQLGSEDLLFLKIYCLTSKQIDSQNVQPNHSSQNVDQPCVSIKPFETYEKAIFGNDEKNISRKTGTDDKIKIQIVFEYYLRPEDQQEQQQQQSANQEPVSQATGLYQKELRSRIIGNMKNLLDCLNAQTLLEYYRVKYPLLKADLHKITNSMTVLNKNHNLSQKQFSINILKHPNSAEYIKKEIKSNHLRELLYLNTSENTHYLVFKQQRPDRNKSVTLFPEQMLKKNNQSQQVYDLDDEDDITILKKFLEAGSVLYVVPFWILLNQKDEKTFYIDCYIPFKRTSQQLNYQMIHDKLSYFLQQLQQRTNQYILFQQMCETHICPPDLKINQKDEIEPSKKETAPKTSKIKQNRYEKNLLFANNKKEQTNTNTQKQWKYKIPMIHQRYFPVYEKFKDNDGLKCIHSNQDFFNNAIRGLDGAYLIPNLKSEYFVIAIEEINNNMMQKSTINTNSSQMSFQGDVSYSQNQTPGSSQKESFLNNNLGQTKGSIFVNSVPYSQNQDTQPKLVSEEFQQSRRLIDMRIYSLNENLDQTDKDYFDNKIKEAQIPETIKQMSSIFLRSSYPKLSHAEYAFIANSDKQTTLKYKIPNFIIDYDSFFIFLKQHLLKVFYKLSIHSNSQNQHSQNSHSHLHHAQTQIFIEDSNQSSQQQPDLTQQSLLSNQNYKPQILNQQKNIQFQYNHENCELNCNNNNLNQSNKIISSEFYDEIEGLTIPYERGEFSFLFNHLKKQNGHTSILRDTFGMCLFIMVMQISFENKNQQYQLEESDLQQQQEFQILDHFHKFFPKQDIQNTEKTDIQNISLGLVSDGYFYDKTHELDHLVHQNQINLFNKPKIINSPISNAFKNFNNNSYNQNAKKTQNQNYAHPQYMMSNQIQNQNQNQSQNQHHLNLSPILGQQQDKADKFLDLTSPVRADKKNDTQNMSNLYDTNSNNFESAKQQINDIPYNNTQNKEMESIKSLESSHNSLVNFDNNYTYQQQVLEFSIIHKGQFIQEKLTTYLTELLNQVTADYLIETIIYKQLMSQNKTAKSILKTINSFDKILLNQKQKSFSLTSLSFKHNLRFKNWFIYFQEIYYRILDIINKKKDGKLQTNPQNQISQDQKQESLTSFDFKEHKFKKCLKNVPHLLAFIENEKQQQQSELQIFSDLEKLEKVYKQYEDKHVVLQKDNNPKIQLVINNNLHEHIFCEQSENLDEEQKAQLGHQYQETYKCIQHFKSDLRVKKEDVNNNKFGKNFYTPRNFFLKLELDKKSFKLLCYNTNSDLIQHMANEIQNIQKIMEQRNLLLQQIIIQKLGIYNYDLAIKPKVSEQKSEFDYIDIINDTTKKLMHETHRKPITQQIYKSINRSKFQIGNLQGNPNVHQSQNFAYTNMAQNQPEKEKLTLTKKVTIYIENILPNLEILAISNEFVEIFDKFKNVTLNKIKPTFTKTDFDEQNESNQIEDQLQIHGMPYLSFAKIFYINNLKKAFFKKMLVLSASEHRSIKEKYVKQFLKGPGQILKQEIIPLFLFPIQEFKTPNIVHMDSSDRNFSNNQIPEPIGQNIGRIEQQENFYSKSLKKLFKSSQNKYSVHVQSELQYEYFMDEQLKGQKRQITNNMNNHNVSSNSLAKSKNIMAFSLSEQLYKLENTQNNQNSNNNGTQFSNINNLSKNSLQSQGSQEELVLVKNSRRAALDFVDKFYTEKAKALLQSTTPILRRMENTIFKKAFQHSVLFLLSLQLDYPLIMQTLFVSSLWNSDSIEAIKNQEMISLFEQEHNYFAYIYYNFHIQLIQLKLKQYEEIEEIQLSLSNKPYYTNDQNEEEMRKRKRQQQIKEEIKNDIKIDIPMIWNHVQNFYSIYNFKSTIFTSHKLVVNIGQMFTSDESDKIMPFLSEHYQQFGFEKQVQLPQSLRIMLINQDYIEELGTTRSKLYVVFKIIDKYEFELFRNIQGSAIKVHKDEESDDNPLFLIYHIFVNESDDKFYQPEIHDPVIQKIHLQTQKIIEETFIRLKKYYTAHAGIEELQQSDNISIFSIKFIRENCIVGSLGNLDQEFQNNLKTVKLFGKDFIDMLKTKYQNEIKRKDFDNKTLLFIIRGDQKLGIMVELCNEQLNDMVFFHAFSNSDDPDLQSLQEELILCVLQWMTIKNYESL